MKKAIIAILKIGISGGIIAYLFIAASRDEHIRAFDTATGKELWKARLPAGGYATPTTYSIDGRQFVVCNGIWNCLCRSQLLEPFIFRSM